MHTSSTRWQAANPPFISSLAPQPDFGSLFRKFSQGQRGSSKPQRRPDIKKPKQPSSRAGSSALGHTISSTAAGAASSSSSGGGLCPLRKALGPLAPFVFNSQGHIACPEAVVRARAALAATAPVRELRPQALPLKILAITIATAALNTPCGAWREHCKKFSLGWFFAVHATIPFIAMLRKAVIMPKYAMVFTICAAVAGQALGARLERQRMLDSQAQVQALPAPAPPTTAHKPAAVPHKAGGTGRQGAFGPHGMAQPTLVAAQG